MKRHCLILLLLAGLIASAIGGQRASATTWAYLYLKVGGVGGSVVASPDGYLVDASCPDQTCVLAYPEGTVVSLTPTGSGFVGWRTIRGRADFRCGNVLVCRSTVSGTMGIKAAYTPVELSVDSTAGGSVDIETPGTSCGNGCRRYAYGGQAVVRAHAEPGYSFAGWSGVCAGIGEGCRITIYDNLLAFAVFRCDGDVCHTKDPVTTDVPVTVVVRGHGSAVYRGIECRSTCTRSFAKRSLLSIDAKPYQGASVMSWSGSVNCAASGTRCSFPVFRGADGRHPVVVIDFS